MKLGEKQYLLKLLKREKQSFEMDRLYKSIMSRLTGEKIKHIKTEEEIINNKIIRTLRI